MKPIHEQEWRARQTTTSVVVGAGDDGPVCTMSKPPAELRLGMEEAHDLMRKRAAAIAALPDCLRALRLLLDAMGGIVATRAEAEAHTAAETALRKAGVIK